MAQNAVVRDGAFLIFRISFGVKAASLEIQLSQVLCFEYFPVRSVLIFDIKALASTL